MGTIQTIHVVEKISISDSIKTEIFKQIDLSSKIPNGSKDAISDFIRENLDYLIKNIESLPNDFISTAPQDFINNLDVIIEIFKIAL